MASDDKIFYVGLCMAGAVSAGAYTAGVMDYLIEALGEWEKRRGQKDVPSHRVVIPVIGGASAGGMTGVITAAALNNPIGPVSMPGSGAILNEQPQNKFYHTWVDLVKKDMFPIMLDSSDINRDKAIVSLLNSDFIDQIAEQVIRVDPSNLKEIPPFFDSQLKLFTTLTNLEGFAYNVGFKANIAGSNYYMAIHNDYACFKLNPESEEDGWIPLDFRNGINVATARDAAMSTGAFPAGLKSRTLKRESKYVNKNPWLKGVTDVNPIQTQTLSTLNVDGGVINNEPFERVREVLTGITGQSNIDEYQAFGTFKSTVLMIDPFPSEKPQAFVPDQHLFRVMGLTLNAMMEQLRAKPANLVDAMDSNKAGQYLIAPSRIRPKLTGEQELVQGSKAIACGGFDGFSGFMNKEFRVHDYFLGRFNCEMFLRNYFTIPFEALDKNEIFRQGYAGVNKDLYKSKDGSLQIIPIFSPSRDGYFPIPVFSSGSTWPVIEDAAIERFRSMIKARVQAIILNSLKANKILLWLGAKILLNKLLTNAAMNTIKNALKEHQLLKGKN